MPLPRTAAELILEVTQDLPGTPAEEHECQGAKYHSPNPLILREVSIVPGRDLADTTMAAWLCGTCHDNLLTVQVLLDAHDGDLDWEVKREFGNQLRALAIDGWQAAHDAYDDQEV